MDLKNLFKKKSSKKNQVVELSNQLHKEEKIRPFETSMFSDDSVI